MSIELTQAELAYLLGTLHAKTVPGLGAPGVFPSNPAARDAQYEKGFAELQQHNFLQADPAQPGKLSLDPFALRLVSVLAEPQFVSYAHMDTARERRAVLHYLADEDIVEVASERDEKFRLGAVATPVQMAQRLIQFVTAGLPSASNKTPGSEEPLAQIMVGQPVNGVLSKGRVIQLRNIRGVHTVIWKETREGKASSLPLSDANLAKALQAVQTSLQSQTE